MKKTTLIILCLFIHLLAFSQKNKEQQFAQTVTKLIKAFSMQDSATLATYIHPQKGVLLLFRQGVFDNLTKLNTISFHDENFPQVLFTNCKGIKTFPMKYAPLPKFNCDKQSWSKKGLFVDIKKTDHLASSICKNRNKYVPDNIPSSTIQKYYKLELNSRRVVLTGNDYENLIFYLSYIDGGWYLTMFDEVTCDCSA